MELALYGLAQLVGHDTCNIAVFCRNPLHPGPCKGFKRTLGGLGASDKKDEPKPPRAPRLAKVTPPKKTGPRDGDGDGKLNEKPEDGPGRKPAAAEVDIPATRVTPGRAGTAPRPAAMGKLSDINLVRGVQAHGSEEGTGKKAADELRRRGLDLDGKPVGGDDQVVPTPAKKAAPVKAVKPPVKEPVAAEPPAPKKAAARARALPAGQRGVLESLDERGDGPLSSHEKRDINALIKKGFVDRFAHKYGLNQAGRDALAADRDREAKKAGGTPKKAAAPAAEPPVKEPVKPPAKKAAPAKKAKPTHPIVDADTYHALQSLDKIPAANQRDPSLPGTPPVDTFLARHAANLKTHGLIELGGPRGRSPIMTPKGKAALDAERRRRVDELTALSAGDEPSPSGFDVSKAAHDTDALDAAPDWARDRKSSAAGAAGDGGGVLAGLAPQERQHAIASMDSYMADGYFDMNGSLHSGKGEVADGTSDVTRSKIDALDGVFSKASTSRDAVLYRGTVLEGDPPDELYNPGFSSATSERSIADEFSKGFYNGAITGAFNMPGKPTVYELRLPKGSKAITVSRYGPQNAAEMLINRGARARKVADRGTVNGIRHVVYEVIPDGE